MNTIPLLDYLTGLPPALIYLVLGAGAAVENIVPPVPADTFVLLGGFIAVSGRANVWIVFIVTWLANVASAVFVYALARKYGPDFFQRPAAHWLLRPRQLDRIGAFYSRWGTPAILISRFLPGLRAIVPVFAGIACVRFARVLVPMAVASAAWYGLLVYLGAVAGRNLEQILGALSHVSTILLVVAVILVLLIARWWWKTRHEPH